MRLENGQIWIIARNEEEEETPKPNPQTKPPNTKPPIMIFIPSPGTIEMGFQKASVFPPLPFSDVVVLLHGETK